MRAKFLVAMCSLALIAASCDSASDIEDGFANNGNVIYCLQYENLGQHAHGSWNAMASTTIGRVKDLCAVAQVPGLVRTSFDSYYNDLQGVSLCFTATIAGQPWTANDGVNPAAQQILIFFADPFLQYDPMPCGDGWYNVEGFHEGAFYGGIDSFEAPPTEWVPMHQNTI